MADYPEPPLFADSGEALAAIAVIDYLETLFTGSNRDEYQREDILVLLNSVKNDPRIIDPDCIIAYQMATEDIP